MSHGIHQIGSHIQPRSDLDSSYKSLTNSQWTTQSFSFNTWSSPNARQPGAKSTIPNHIHYICRYFAIIFIFMLVCTTKNCLADFTTEEIPIIAHPPNQVHIDKRYGVSLGPGFDLFTGDVIVLSVENTNPIDESPIFNVLAQNDAGNIVCIDPIETIALQEEVYDQTYDLGGNGQQPGVTVRGVNSDTTTAYSNMGWSTPQYSVETYAEAWTPSLLHMFTINVIDGRLGLFSLSPVVVFPRSAKYITAQPITRRSGMAIDTGATAWTRHTNQILAVNEFLPPSEPMYAYGAALYPLNTIGAQKWWGTDPNAQTPGVLGQTNSYSASTFTDTWAESASDIGQMYFRPSASHGFCACSQGFVQCPYLGQPSMSIFPSPTSLDPIFSKFKITKIPFSIVRQLLSNYFDAVTEGLPRSFVMVAPSPFTERVLAVHFHAAEAQLAVRRIYIAQVRMSTGGTLLEQQLSLLLRTLVSDTIRFSWNWRTTIETVAAFNNAPLFYPISAYESRSDPETVAQRAAAAASAASIPSMYSGNTGRETPFTNNIAPNGNSPTSSSSSFTQSQRKVDTTDFTMAPALAAGSGPGSSHYFQAQDASPAAQYVKERTAPHQKVFIKVIERRPNDPTAQTPHIAAGTESDSNSQFIRANAPTGTMLGAENAQALLDMVDDEGQWQFGASDALINLCHRVMPTESMVMRFQGQADLGYMAECRGKLSQLRNQLANAMNTSADDTTHMVDLGVHYIGSQSDQEGAAAQRRIPHNYQPSADVATGGSTDATTGLTTQPNSSRISEQLHSLRACQAFLRHTPGAKNCIGQDISAFFQNTTGDILEPFQRPHQSHEHHITNTDDDHVNGSHLTPEQISMAMKQLFGASSEPSVQASGDTHDTRTMTHPTGAQSTAKSTSKSTFNWFRDRETFTRLLQQLQPLPDSSSSSTTTPQQQRQPQNRANTLQHDLSLGANDKTQTSPSLQPFYKSHDQIDGSEGLQFTTFQQHAAKSAQINAQARNSQQQRHPNHQQQQSMNVTQDDYNIADILQQQKLESLRNPQHRVLTSVEERPLEFWFPAASMEQSQFSTHAGQQFAWNKKGSRDDALEYEHRQGIRAEQRRKAIEKAATKKSISHNNDDVFAADYYQQQQQQRQKKQHVFHTTSQIGQQRQIASTFEDLGAAYDSSLTRLTRLILSTDSTDTRTPMISNNPQNVSQIESQNNDTSQLASELSRLSRSELKTLFAYLNIPESCLEIHSIQLSSPTPTAASSVDSSKSQPSLLDTQFVYFEWKGACLDLHNVYLDGTTPLRHNSHDNTDDLLHSQSRPDETAIIQAQWVHHAMIWFNQYLFHSIIHLQTHSLRELSDDAFLSHFDVASSMLIPQDSTRYSPDTHIVRLTDLETSQIWTKHTSFPANFHFPSFPDRPHDSQQITTSLPQFRQFWLAALLVQAMYSSNTHRNQLLHIAGFFESQTHLNDSSSSSPSQQPSVPSLDQYQMTEEYHAEDIHPDLWNISRIIHSNTTLSQQLQREQHTDRILHIARQAQRNFTIPRSQNVMTRSGGSKHSFKTTQYDDHQSTDRSTRSHQRLLTSPSTISQRQDGHVATTKSFMAKFNPKIPHFTSHLVEPFIADQSTQRVSQKTFFQPPEQQQHRVHTTALHPVQVPSYVANRDTRSVYTRTMSSLWTTFKRSFLPSSATGDVDIEDDFSPKPTLTQSLVDQIDSSALIHAPSQPMHDHLGWNPISLFHEHDSSIASMYHQQTHHHPHHHTILSLPDNPMNNQHDTPANLAPSETSGGGVYAEYLRQSHRRSVLQRYNQQSPRDRYNNDDNDDKTVKYSVNQHRAFSAMGATDNILQSSLESSALASLQHPSTHHTQQSHGNNKYSNQFGQSQNPLLTSSQSISLEGFHSTPSLHVPSSTSSSSEPDPSPTSFFSPKQQQDRTTKDPFLSDHSINSDPPSISDHRASADIALLDEIDSAPADPSSTTTTSSSPIINPFLSPQLHTMRTAQIIPGIINTGYFIIPLSISGGIDADYGTVLETVGEYALLAPPKTSHMGHIIQSSGYSTMPFTLGLGRFEFYWWGQIIGDSHIQQSIDAIGATAGVDTVGSELFGTVNTGFDGASTAAALADAVSDPFSNAISVSLGTALSYQDQDDGSDGLHAMGKRSHQHKTMMTQKQASDNGNKTSTSCGAACTGNDVCHSSWVQFKCPQRQTRAMIFNSNNPAVMGAAAATPAQPPQHNNKPTTQWFDHMYAHTLSSLQTGSKQHLKTTFNPYILQQESVEQQRGVARCDDHSTHPSTTPAVVKATIFQTEVDDLDDDSDSHVEFTSSSCMDSISFENAFDRLTETIFKSDFDLYSLTNPVGLVHPIMEQHHFTISGVYTATNTFFTEFVIEKLV